MSRITVENLACGYKGKVVRKDLNFCVDSGEILCILGPNGIGKTTLFKTMMGLLPAIEGKVMIDGNDISGWNSRQRAQCFGYVPQSHVPPFSFSVRQVVVMGRTAHLRASRSPSVQDHAIAENAMNALNILDLAERPYTNLSGGERQMVLIARALTQEPDFLIMDEPAANLDFGNQAIVLNEVRKLADTGIGIVMTTHTPDHAFMCDAKTLLIEKDRTTCGPAREVVTGDNLARAYKVNVGILEGTYEKQQIRACVPVLSKSDHVSRDDQC